ncbi:MAG: lipocalin family protein, partial [Chitinophagales bacterium]
LLPSCLQEKINRRTEDISRGWELVRKELNDNNVTEQFKATHNDYIINFSSDGVFNESYADGLGTLQDITGTWFFLNNVNELKLEDGSQERFYDILELNGARLTLQTLNTDDVEVFYLEPL